MTTRKPAPKSSKKPANQIAFRYRSADTVAGVSRATTRRLMSCLGVDETQVIHLALREFAQRHLPQYPADDGPLTASQIRQIRKHVPQKAKRSVRSSLIEMATV